MIHLSSFNISSKHYVNAIEANIIQLTKALSLEHSMSVDDAKDSARTIVQEELSTGLLDDGVREKLSNLLNETIRKLRANPSDEYISEVYNALKLFGVEE